MKTAKPFYFSVGVMGPLAGLIVFVLNNFVFKSPVVSEGDITELVNQINVVWTALTGIWGRVRATETIGSRA